MTKNPIVNALGASIYIILVVVVMTFVTEPMKNKSDTFFAPIMMLFVLTLSVTVMAYLFFYQPFILYFDNKKKDALDLFIKTILIFGMITLTFLLVLYFGAMK
ncbi:MAG: hypothetical protein PHR98_03765 [Candidatus Shapirobacteria bacterium]|jgi:hypothetical protein|nr:hypothetical protein [Candidatus Shapirobacteria bacterium]